LAARWRIGEALGGRRGLDREGLAAQRPLEHRLARTPVDVAQGQRAALVKEFDREIALPADLHAPAMLADRHDPLGARLAGQARGVVASPSGIDPLHGRTDGGENVELGGRRLGSGEAFRELVLDVVGRDLARAEPLLIHHGGQERDVLARPSMWKSSSARPMPSIAARRVGAQAHSLEIIGS
jgi:hypothetical protein